MDANDKKAILTQVTSIERWKGTAYMGPYKGEGDCGTDYEGDEVHEALANLRVLAGEPYPEVK